MENNQLLQYKWMDSVEFIEEYCQKSLNKNDLEQIQLLKTHYSFPKEVLNVLLELILSINHNQLQPDILHRIACDWKKRNINSFTKALEEADHIRDFLTNKTKQKINHYQCNNCSGKFDVAFNPASLCPICASFDISRKEC